MDLDVDHRLSLGLADFNQYGSLDIYCVEIHLDGSNPDAGNR